MQILLPHFESPKGLESALRVAQDIAVYLVMLIVKPHLIEAWKLKSVTADQGSCLLWHFFLGENSIN